MNITPVPLAPDIIKSLANQLARSPLLADKKLRRAQSIEAMSVILGYDSWYLAQRQSKRVVSSGKQQTTTVNLDNPELQPAVLFTDRIFRRNFYLDMVSMLEAGVNIVYCGHALRDSGRIVGDVKRLAMGYHLIEDLEAGHSASHFFECLRDISPLEMLAIQSSETHATLGDGFKEALRICA